MRRRKSESGASLVETALVMPLLVLVLFGIIQWAYIMSAYITVRNASAVGARAAALNGATCSTATNDTTSACATAAINALQPTYAQANARVDVVKYTLNTKDAWRITVTYRLPVTLSFLIPGASGGVKVISSSSTMS